jgi:gamma-glutamylcyclotransferase (GGCT)/AIG2-like uncharacterized protein YtfP
MKKTLSILLLIFAFSITASAHSGSTDADGGHLDKTSGEYHYHHGYPAHNHTDGICPYNYDNAEAEHNYYESDEEENSSVKKSKCEYNYPSCTNPNSHFHGDLLSITENNLDTLVELESLKNSMYLYFDSELQAEYMIDELLYNPDIEIYCFDKEYVEYDDICDVIVNYFGGEDYAYEVRDCIVCHPDVIIVQPNELNCFENIEDYEEFSENSTKNDEEEKIETEENKTSESLKEWVFYLSIPAIFIFLPVYIPEFIRYIKTRKKSKIKNVAKQQSPFEKLLETIRLGTDIEDVDIAIQRFSAFYIEKGKDIPLELYFVQDSVDYQNLTYQQKCDNLLKILEIGLDVKGIDNVEKRLREFYKSKGFIEE